jgi:iron complex outermembrane receptor protein
MAVTIALIPHQDASAAESDAADSAQQDLEQVIVTGTRRAERTVLESNVPVDVVSEKDFQSAATSDLSFKLQSLVPSYNVRRIPTGDGNIFVRPATLRNLSPDHTLVLVDGKRFHRSSFVDIAGNRGFQAPDLALLPAGAFQRAEVLRDGASAQYGSDAIAGVINFILNDKPGTNAYAQYGEFSKGDGQNLQMGLSSGFAFAGTGHLNVTAEYVDNKASTNGIQRPQATLIEAAGEPYASSVRSIGDVVQRYGVPAIESGKVFINSGYELSNGVKLYAFGNFSQQTGVSDFNYRPSLTVTGPDADGVTTTFARNGAYNLKSNGKYSIYQTAGSNASGSWTATDPDFSPLTIYPGGFTPRFGSDTQDWSFAAGTKGTLGQNLDWDLSATAGSNRIDYWLKDSINLSLGSASPLDFPDAGSREQREQTANLDFVYPWQTALAKPVNVGFGAEYHREEFRIRAGQYESWAVGPLKDLSPASNGFAGAHPATAGVWDSDNVAGYVDLDIDVTSRLNVGLAGRVEDSSLFGTTTNGKISARFAFNDVLALRGAASTGFRAPTPGQQYLQNVAQNPNTNPAFARSVDVRAVLPSNSAAAALFGGEALKPEKSVNLSLGLVLQPTPGLAVTLDAYQIDINDRIGISQAFELTQSQREQLIAAAVPLASELTHVSFFTNNFDTRTQGVDLVATWRVAAGPGNLGLTWASNYNKTQFTDYSPALFPEWTRVGYVDNVPRFTSHLTAEYQWSKLRLLGRLRHFDEWTYVAAAGATNGAGVVTTQPIYQNISAVNFVDLIGSWQFTSRMDVSLGIENVLDAFSDKVDLVTLRNNGRQYPGGAPYENEGRNLYGRVNFRF